MKNHARSIKHPNPSVLFPTKISGSSSRMTRRQHQITHQQEMIKEEHDESTWSYMHWFCAVILRNMSNLSYKQSLSSSLPLSHLNPSTASTPWTFLAYRASAAKQTQCQRNNVFLHPFKTYQVCTYRASIQDSGLNFKPNQLSPTNSKHLAQLSEWGLQGWACAPCIPDTAGISGECKARWRQMSEYSYWNI